MAYTEHGYWIPGTDKQHKTQYEAATCGGPDRCVHCFNRGPSDAIDVPIEMIGFIVLPRGNESRQSGKPISLPPDAPRYGVRSFGGK